MNRYKVTCIVQSSQRSAKNVVDVFVEAPPEDFKAMEIEAKKVIAQNGLIFIRIKNYVEEQLIVG